MIAAASPTSSVTELPRLAAPLLGVMVLVGVGVLLAVPVLVLLEPEPPVVVALAGSVVKVEMGRMLPDEVMLPTGAMVVTGAAAVVVVVVISTVDKDVTTADVAVALAVVVASTELVVAAPTVNSGVSLLSEPWEISSV